MTDQPENNQNCLNCDRPLEGENYCPNCGQRNDTRRQTLKDLLHESLSNFLAVDGRLWRTLYNLFRYPGKVPYDYMMGKRMRYMPPIRIYFLASLIMLFLIQFQEDEPQIAQVKETRDGQVALDLTQDTSRTNVENADDMLMVPVEVDLDLEHQTGLIDKLNVMTDFAKEHPGLREEAALDSLHLDNSLWNRFLYEQSIKASRFDLKDFNKTLVSKLFWILFFFVPILGLILKLLYVRRPFYYPEHLFFGFYNQSVFFLLAAIGFLIDVNDGIAAVFFILYGIYLFIAMQKFYEQGFFKTLLKFILVNILGVIGFFAFFLCAMVVVFILS